MPWSFRLETVLAVAMPGLRVVAVEHSPLPFDREWMRRLKPALAAGYAAHVAVGEQAARDIEGFAGLRAGAVRAIPVGVGAVRASSRGDRADGSAADRHHRPPRPAQAPRRPPARARASSRGRARLVGDGPEWPASSRRGRVRRRGSHPLRGLVGRHPRLARPLGRFVLPSSMEGLPLTILDAMLAAHAGDRHPVGSVPEAIRPNGPACWSPSATRRASPPPPPRTRRPRPRAPTRRRRPSHARARYTPPAMARAYEALYTEILG